MSTSRRQFLTGCSAAVAAMAGSRLSSLCFSDANAPAPADAEILVVLFLRGGMDGLNLVAPPHAESMRSNLTDLRSFIIMLDGVGHWPQLEAPDATNAALLAFLRSL